MDPNSVRSEVTRLRRPVRRGLALLASAALAAAGAVGLSLPAAAATITTAAFAVSNNVVGASGVTYNWIFVPASSGDLSGKTITLTVPAGTTWTAAAPTAVYGITNSAPGTVTFSANTITVPFTTGTLTSGRPVSITFGSFTNSATATPSFASTITTTYVSGGDTGSTTAVSIAANQTQVTVLVPQSLTYAISTTAVSLAPIPGGGIVEAAPVALTVSTNAHGGYALKAVLGAALTDTNSDTVTSIAANTTADLSSSTGFGARATVSGATLSAPWSSTASTTYAGYAATVGASGATVATNTGPTAGDTITLINAVKIPGTQAAGTYTGNVTYAVVPSF